MCECAMKLTEFEQRIAKLEARNAVQPVESPKKEGGMLASATEFDQWWAAYPNKVGKKAAQKAFQNARDRPRINDLLAAIEKAKRSKKWQEGFIPLPTTWLNQGRWDDEPSQSVAPQPKAQVKIERTITGRQEYSPPPPEVMALLGRIGKGMG